ncbi:integrator complex subunit 11 [Anaeramoeba ignava]|uniref:Integrator complex subunit 11 n=1 Tax=Anaeramoeba ignava TaxID=1746090 RepID=A0A9Q0LTA3_ANAIG|nr:integrator complex subunit 11 [Anaeramoeba ignava]
MGIQFLALGAGRMVGRSCLIVTMGNKTIMLDCGVHLGKKEERFPDFSQIKTKIDCVIISHFHLDHCGALPYFTEKIGYSGPIYMTTPTKAICPIILEDYVHVTSDSNEETPFFSSQMIKDSMNKVIGINFLETIEIEEDFEIRAYYAGHVLGAALFYVRVGQESIVYTGDFSMTSDQHLGSASIEKLNPDLLITESTYGHSIRDPKSSREKHFLKLIHEHIDKGGKVLIPVFSLGRAQELCILLETYWERMGLDVPIYLATGLAEKANEFYKIFSNWMNQELKDSVLKKNRNVFEFRHIKPFDRTKVSIETPGPMVMFASPGMLHSGTSLAIFRIWAPLEKNLVIIPGYCVSGTVGSKLSETGPHRVEIGKGEEIQVNCKVKFVSFSAHADMMGIIHLIKQCEPKKIALVHGEFGNMSILRNQIQRLTKIPCSLPKTGQIEFFETIPKTEIKISRKLIQNELKLTKNDNFMKFSKYQLHNFKRVKVSENENWINGITLTKRNNQNSNNISKIYFLDPEKTIEKTNLVRHKMKFLETLQLQQEMIPQRNSEKEESIIQVIANELKQILVGDYDYDVFVDQNDIKVAGTSIKINSKNQQNIVIEWEFEDEDIALRTIGVLKQRICK